MANSDDKHSDIDSQHRFVPKGDNKHSDIERSTDSDHTRFIPKDDDDLWEVIEITDERETTYRVRWAGTNPKTRKPWPLQWVPKEDVTNDLVITWKQVRAKRRKTVSTKRTRKMCTSPTKRQSIVQSPMTGEHPISLQYPSE